MTGKVNLIFEEHQSDGCKWRGLGDLVRAG